MNLTPVCTNTCLVTYKGENLDNIGAKKGTKLNTILKNISNLLKNQPQTGGKVKRHVFEGSDIKENTGEVPSGFPQYVNIDGITTGDEIIFTVPYILNSGYQYTGVTVVLDPYPQKILIGSTTPLQKLIIYYYEQ